MIHRKEIDGLRALAVMPVILWHAGFDIVSGGYAGVDVFFVISGFLIASILLEDMKQDRYSILRFYERRARRILPALVLVISVSYIFGWLWLIPSAFSDFSKSILAALFFVSNFYFWLSTDYFSTAADHLPLIHTWSLSVEEQFYLVFPPLLYALWRFARRWILHVLVGLALASLVSVELLRDTEADMVFFLAPTRAWELLAGAILAFVQVKRNWVPQPGPQAQGLSALGLAMICLPFVLYDEFTPDPSVYMLVPVIGTVLVLGWARQGTLVAAFLSLRPMTAIGLISYSAYLWHQPIFAFARIRLAGDPSTPIMLGLCGLSLVLAALSWRFVEQPMRKSGPGAFFTVPRFAISMAGATAALALIVVLGVSSGGARFRLPPEVNALANLFEAEGDKRLAAVRIGACQFNEISTGATVEDFLEDWDCRAKAEEGLVPTKIALYGDSHAADIAAAIRLNGYDLTQVTGAGCALAPTMMSKDCRRLADFMKEEVVRSGTTRLWLANRFNGREASLPVLEETIAFWSLPGVDLSIFSSRPEFDDFEDKMISAKWRGSPLELEPDMTRPAAFLTPENLQMLAQNAVQVLDSGEIFCGTTQAGHCLPLDGETLLMTDGQHFSVEGATRFGAALFSQIGTP